MIARQPSAYVHATDGCAVVVVPARVAAWLERHADLRRVRTQARGVDGEVDAVLVALGVAAAQWRTSVTGSPLAVAAEAEARSGWMSTSQAADALDLTSRAVRLACEERRLPAEQVDGRWRITREDVEHYRAHRGARPQEPAA